MTGSLPDQAARDAIRTQLERSIFVEAGAGTGKTSELVKRIVALITSGRAKIDQIVAITFTEAAAGELRERVRTALEADLRDSASDDKMRLCRAAVAAIDDAPIQTIHGFTRRMLLRHPTEVGLPPVFEVHEQVASRLHFDRRWRRFLTSTFASGTPLEPSLDHLLRTSLAMGVEPRHLRQLAWLMEQSWHRLPAVDHLPTEPPAVDPSPLIKQASSLVDLSVECQDPTSPALRRLKEWREWCSLVEGARASDSWLRVLEVLTATPPATLGSTRYKGVWPKPVFDELKDGLKALQADIDDALLEVRQYVIEGLTGLCSRFVLEGAHDRVSAGTLDFHDLLVYARNLLRDHEDVRAQLQSAYRYVLVDEFQDTDPLQAEIVGYLTEGRSLFVVGDPKQSIYRFRNADPAQYAATRESLSSSVVGLTSNFRTLPAVVHWVNAVFEDLLFPSIGEEWQALDAGRANAVPASVHLVGEHVDRRLMNAAAVRATEAQQLVEVMTRAKSENWAVEDDNGRRPLRFGDMAILMPTRTALAAMERALKTAAIPYRIESRSLIWSTQELRDVVSTLRSIDDPSDEIGTVAALRSPVFGCTDRDLLEWSSTYRTWDYTSHVVTEYTGSMPVGLALQRFNAFHQRRHWMTVPDLVLSVVGEFRFFEVAYALPRQRESWSRLRFLIDRARHWFEEGGGALHDFVVWCRMQADEGVDALESVLPEKDDDAVRVMTVHASKGLEFPFVVLTGLASTAKRSDAAYLHFGADGEPQVKLGATP